MRNIAIGLGNAHFSNEIIATLKQTREQYDEIVQVHIDWAIQEQLTKSC